MTEDLTDAKEQAEDAAEGTSEKKSKRQKSWRGRLLWAAGVAILAGGATVYAVPLLEGLEEQRTEIAESAAELEVLVAENADLEERLGALNTPIEIERLARERLGYVREGETAFVVVSPPPDPSEPSVVEPAAETPTNEGDPWYKDWWSYISGSDLAADS